MYGNAFLAAVLGLCLLAGAAAQGTTFPFCDCVRPQGLSTSPYRLDLTSTTTGADGATKVCWALTTVPNASGRCARFDLKKIEYDINVNCRGSVKNITFGTSVVSTSYSAYPEQNGMVFKITYGTRNLATYSSLAGKTTPLCITLAAKQACSTLPTFCRNGDCNFAFFSPDDKCCPGQVDPPLAPSPPPPPPPPVTITPFPYCACDTSTPAQQYSLSPSASAPLPTRANGRNTYCWSLSATRYTGNATTCVNYDLKKIEFDIKTTCQGAVTGITLDGQVVSPSYSRYPKEGALVFKVTRGTNPLASLSSLIGSPKRMCVTLGDVCPTLASFCRTPFCTVAYFSPNNKCCPLQSLVAAS